MPTLNDVTVSVLINGQPAAEFDDPDLPTEADKTTRYIEIESGAEFSFKIELGGKLNWQEATAITSYVNLDGASDVPGIVQYKSQITTHRVSYIDGVWSGGGSHAKQLRWKFADLETREKTDQDDDTTWKAKYGSLGTLIVKLFRSHVLNTRDYSGVAKSIDAEAVPEKALKGRPLDVKIEHNAVTGKPRPKTAEVKNLGGPFATFTFLYRTRRALQSLLIIERDPTPTPLEDRDPDTLTREELLELERRRRAAEAIKKELKRERSENEEDGIRLKSVKGSGGKRIYVIDSDEEDGDDENDEDVQVVKPEPKEPPEVVTLL